MDRYDVLFREVEKRQPQHILEIGTWNGHHAKQMIEIAQKGGKTIYYYGFDLFEPAPDYEISQPYVEMDYVQNLLSQTGANIFLVKGNTRETLPENVPHLPKMDFIYIDGGHSKETIASDWENVKNLIKDNTYVIFDDYYIGDLERGAKTTVDSLKDYKVELIGDPVTYINEFGTRTVVFAKVTK